MLGSWHGPDVSAEAKREDLVGHETYVGLLSVV